MFDRKSEHRFLFLTWVFVSCLILAPQATSAQTVTGTLQGTVTDTKAAVVPGVTVVVHVPRNIQVSLRYQY
ncbi:MAG TPA: hypothetical protein VMZ30_01530 [Pyrinomonadaceae bacterium]|nr:hypothetical protein [Pyrinomonadaceae bacterium]